MILAALGAGLAFQLLLGTSYVAASLDPVGASVGLPVAVVVLDEGERGDEVLRALRAADGPVAWIELPSRASAVEALAQKEAYGGLVLPPDFTEALESVATDAPRAATVEVLASPGASTSGNVVAQRAIDAALDALRARVQEEAIAALDVTPAGVLVLNEAQARTLAQPVQASTTIVNPVAAKGGNGLAPTYLAMACWIGGYIGSAALERFREASGLRTGRRAFLVAGGALANGILATIAISLVGLHVPDPVSLALVLALGTWMAYALVSLLMDVFGLAGVLPAFAILALGLPASGAIYPTELLPGFFRALHHASPFTWLVEGLRTTLHARGADDLAGHALSLGALAVAASLLSLAVARLRPTRG